MIILQTGKLVNDLGIPIRNASIKISNKNSAFMTTTTTDDDGVWKARLFAPGTYVAEFYDYENAAFKIVRKGFFIGDKPVRKFHADEYRVIKEK